MVELKNNRIALPTFSTRMDLQTGAERGTALLLARPHGHRRGPVTRRGAASLRAEQAA